MSDRKIHARASVRVTLEIPTSGGGWGSACTIDQVYKQAAEDVRGQLRNLIAGQYDQTHPVQSGKWKIVGEPVITGILTEER